MYLSNQLEKFYFQMEECYFEIMYLSNQMIKYDFQMENFFQ